MRFKIRALNLTIIGLLCITLLGAGYVMKPSTADAAGSSWSVNLSKTAGNSSLGYTAYRSMQGVAFDTYTGKDGYVFVQSDNKKYMALIHFTMDSKGWIMRTKKVVYKAANLGHANDGTIYKDAKGVKWLIFASCGTYSEKITAKASDGTKVNLGAIKLSEYYKGKKKVYSCNVSGVVSSAASPNITGVTFMGRKPVLKDNKVTRSPVFALLNGKTIYEATLTQSGNKLTFKKTGSSGWINKPCFSNGAEAATQGIAYHNNYIYMTAEGTGTNASTAVVARISLTDLFNGEANMDVFRKSYKTLSATQNGTKATFTKNGPEAVFFTTLNKKSKMYVAFNRVLKSNNKDDDAIMRSDIRY